MGKTNDINTSSIKESISPDVVAADYNSMMDQRQTAANDAQGLKQSGTKGINMCYLTCVLLTISLGTIQFGYSIGCWNTASGAYGKRIGWDDDEKTYQNTLIQSLTTAGSAVGALFSGPALGLGRWNCIVITNLFVVIGCSLTLVDNLHSLYIGRFLYGIAAGCFSVFCPKFISETAPTEVKGPAGALSQICVTFGILVPFAIGLGIGDVDELDIDSFEIQYYWYILFSIPIGLAVIQTFLLITVFNYDTPPMLKQKGQYEKLRAFIAKIYQPHLVQERIEELNAGDQVSEMQEGEGEEVIGYKAVCCGKYSGATFVGCSLAIFQQLTGINIIMFYSNTIFANTGASPTTITALVGVVNFFSTLVGMALLGLAGRKTIMFTCSGLMAVTLIALGYTGLHDMQGAMIALVMTFIALFEFSSGPITWLYMAEIMQDKSVSIATVLNWLINLAISIATPPLVAAVGDENIGYIFVAMGAFTVLGTLFIAVFMKETRGKSSAQIQELFMSEQEREAMNNMKHTKAQIPQVFSKTNDV